MSESFSLFLQQFHFLRPLWLLMLLPCIVLVLLLWRQRRHHGSWSKVIAPSLLPYLLAGEPQKTARWPLILLLAGWVLAALALAGPAWQQLPVPVSKNQQPLVVAVDLSYDMYATDLSPNRLARVRFKLQDLFKQRSEGLSALVAYAGSAHTVAPLTDDSRTLNNLTKALGPEIMPLPGNHPAAAVRLAQQLLTQGGNPSGDILLVTGSVSEAEAREISDQLKGSNIRLSILGTGTEQGAPILLPDGGYLKDQQGAIVVPQLNPSRLQSLARANGGGYQTMTVADTDLKALLPTANLQQLFNAQTASDRQFDQWDDAGYWLVWLLLPAALFGFRRGWLLLLMITLLPAAPDAMAFGWNDLWQTRDQQGQQALQDGNPELAASLFNDPNWKAEALFQNQQFEQAVATLNAETVEGENATSVYNRANALAKAGKLQEAIDAYDQALAQQPDMEDARFNRDIVEQLLQQQSQQNQQGKQGKQGQQNSEQNSGQEGANQQQSQDGQQQPQSSGQNLSDSSPPDNQASGANSQEQEQASAPQQQDSGDNAANDQSQQPQDQQQSPSERPEKASGDSSPQTAQTEQNKEGNEEQEARTAVAEEPTDEEPLSPEQQAINSWLRTIPDDPGGLLRRKFLQQQQRSQHSQKQQKKMEGASW